MRRAPPSEYICSIYTIHMQQTQINACNKAKGTRFDGGGSNDWLRLTTNVHNKESWLLLQLYIHAISSIIIIIIIIINDVVIEHINMHTREHYIYGELNRQPSGDVDVDHTAFHSDVAAPVYIMYGAKCQV